MKSAVYDGMIHTQYGMWHHWVGSGAPVHTHPPQEGSITNPYLPMCACMAPGRCSTGYWLLGNETEYYKTHLWGTEMVLTCYNSPASSREGGNTRGSTNNNPPDTRLCAEWVTHETRAISQKCEWKSSSSQKMIRIFITLGTILKK